MSIQFPSALSGGGAQEQPPLIVIAGATASGKSSLALQIAHKYNGSIINADSMQVYRQTRILTARPSQEDEMQIPHFLYGHIDMAQSYDVKQWILQVCQAIEDVYNSGRRPILVGGTGLYLHSLLEGISEIPNVPEDVQNKFRLIGEKEGAVALHEGLKEIDNVAYQRISSNDMQRILRVYSVYEVTGKNLTYWQSKTVNPVFLGKVTKILLMPERDWLYERCNQRLLTMVEQGVMNEIQEIAGLDLPVHLSSMKMIGLAELLSVYEGKQSFEQAIKLGQRATRRYVKRQMTWFRNKMIAFKTFNAQEYCGNVREVFAYVVEND